MSGPEGLRTWAPFACSLAAERSAGIRSVNAWAYAEQPLPDGSGSAAWVCTRAETWRGDGTAALAQFRHPGRGGQGGRRQGHGRRPAGRGIRMCWPGVLWKSAAGSWYLLAAGSKGTASISAAGGVIASGQGPLLAAKAEQGRAGGLDGDAGGRAGDQRTALADISVNKVRRRASQTPHPSVH